MGGLSLSTQAHIEVTKYGGGPNGYYYVHETHEKGNAKLNCEGAGYDQCGWTTPPTDHEANAELYVSEQISQGITSGSTTMDGYLIKWVGSDIYNYKMTEDAISD